MVFQEIMCGEMYLHTTAPQASCHTRHTHAFLSCIERQAPRLNVVPIVLLNSVQQNLEKDATIIVFKQHQSNNLWQKIRQIQSSVPEFQGMSKPPPKTKSLVTFLHYSNL